MFFVVIEFIHHQPKIDRRQACLNAGSPGAEQGSYVASQMFYAGQSVACQVPCRFAYSFATSIPSPTPMPWEMPKSVPASIA